MQDYPDSAPTPEEIAEFLEAIPYDRLPAAITLLAVSGGPKLHTCGGRKLHTRRLRGCEAPGVKRDPRATS